MTYEWRTWDHSRVHHARIEGYKEQALCEVEDGKRYTTSIKEPGALEKCIRCIKLVVDLGDGRRPFEDVS